MKIYILPTEDKFRPNKQAFNYPIHNKDYGVEQDFYNYLKTNTELLTTSPTEAEWHYMPIYWTRWHLNHDYAKSGLEELQQGFDSSIINNKKTFTICQYDDGPVINTGHIVTFLSSRKTDTGIDIPLLASPHKLPFFYQKKKYLSSFAGRLSTHELRVKMNEELSHEDGIKIVDGNKGANYFKKLTLRSYSSLCPRGYGGSSFRFFESMQLGVVPFLISDLDTRPFKEFINWESISLFTQSPETIMETLKRYSFTELEAMGSNAKKCYYENIQYGKWCKYVIKTLESLNK